MLRPGAKLSHYTIVAQIGAGGMGEVYRARDEHLNREVAVKVLPSGALSDEQARKRFRREAETLSKLNHPHIATVHDFDTQDGVDFLVMEYVPGETLKEKLDGGPLPEKEISKLGAQVADALDTAHEKGVIHRDLKPGNIALNERGDAKVLDFGIAKLLRSKEELAEAATVDTLTKTVGMAGTLPYMSPEQLRGEEVDARTDIYALGTVLYEMATGQRAFPETQSARLMQAILTEAPTAPTQRNSRVSPELERIILKCMEKDQENRYQHADELAVDLRRLGTATQTAADTPWQAPRGSARWGWRIGGVAVAAIALLAVWAFFYFQPAQALSETDYLLLTDFVNKTGDEVFDGTLKAGLAVKLQESPFLNIVPEQQVRRTLRLMERSPDEPITAEVGQEICQRQGTKAMITGEIATLGNNYAITLNAVNCATGDSLAREQVEAASKEEVLGALGQASSRLREKLGESLRSIEKYDTPLMQATTSSLQALKALSLGDAQRAKGPSLQAVALYKRAIELDPTFALAYIRLGIAYSNLGESELGRKYKKKAYELRERVSEWERIYISAHYYGTIGELEKVIETYELWKEIYPRDVIPFNNVGLAYLQTAQYDKALENFQEALRLNPSMSNIYGNLAGAYRRLNRFDEARAILERNITQVGDRVPIRVTLYRIAFVQGDTEAMQRHAEWAKGKTGEGWMIANRAAVAAFSGRLRRSRELSRQAVTLTTSEGFNEVATYYVANEAVREARFGNLRQARERAETVLAMTPSWVERRIAAHALILSGDVRQAQRIVDDLEKRFPTSTLWHAVDLPILLGEIELQRGNPTRTVELLQPAVPYELGSRAGFRVNFLRGRAYLQAGEATQAAEEFQKILAHRGVGILSTMYPLAHLGLARSYALAGNTAGARQAYEDFFDLWKDADPDIPILLEAKAEYAKLNQ